MFGEIQTLGVSLGAADERINLANLKLAQVQDELAVNRRRLNVAKTNWRRTQKQIANELVSLYVSPPPSTLGVILGATSLNGLLSGVDDSHRLAELDRQLIGEVKTFKTAVERHGRELSREQAQAAHLLAQRRDEQASVAAQLAERQRLLGSIRSEITKLEAEQEARQLALARAAQRAFTVARARQERLEAATVIGASATAPDPSPVAVAAPAQADPATAPASPPVAPQLSYGTQTATVIPTSSVGSQAVSIAMSYIGTPYLWGGATPGGFACSGLVMYAYAQLGVSLPHSSYAMWNYGVSVPEGQLEPGDLVFFDGLGHVGLYVGGGDYVDAPYTGVDVRIDSLSDPWAAANYVGARRIL